MKKAARLIAVNVAIFMGMLIIIEGSSSMILFVKDILGSPGKIIAERLHTKYDRDLGWINAPATFLPDMYGPGKDVRINSQSFRGSRDYSTAVPPGKVRIVCSGDSFTFGYGVGNDKEWCSLLEKFDSRIETINMGVGGYGVDQAYLWYVRAGLKLEHDIHVFAFTWWDFGRMRNDELSGYGKPVLSFENGELKTKNTPVPRSILRFRILEPYREAIERLRIHLLTVELRRRADTVFRGRTEDLVYGVFNSLSKQAHPGSRLIFVYLPSEMDVRGENTVLREGLSDLCRQNGWDFLDLTRDMRAAYGESGKSLFVQPDELPQFKSAANHFTEEGNKIIAQGLYEKFVKMPAVMQKINAVHAAGSN